MTKKEKQEILSLPTIATCWEDYPGGVEIKKFEYGIDDYCICVTQTMTTKPRVHRVKVHPENRACMYIDGFQVHFDNCWR